MSHLLGKQIPCGLTDDCARVALHPSSQWFGVPVAAFGLGAYVVLGALALLRFAASGGRFAMLAMVSLLISALGLGVSVYLTYTAIAVIQATCKWCLASAILMVALFLIHAVIVQSGPPAEPETTSEPRGLSDSMTWGGVVGILVLGSLAYGYKTLQSQASYGKSVVELAKSLKPDELVYSKTHYQGPADAKITIIEFADFYCESCRAAYTDVKDVLKAYGGKIRLGFSNYPLFEKEGHELSLMAAAATIYADEKGKYWDLVNRLFEVPIQEITGQEGLLSVIASAGIDTADFMRRYKDGDEKLLDPLSSIQAIAVKYGVDRTPTWIVFAPGTAPRYVSTRLTEVLNEPEYQQLLK